MSQIWSFWRLWWKAWTVSCWFVEEVGRSLLSTLSHKAYFIDLVSHGRETWSDSEISVTWVGGSERNTNGHWQFPTQCLNRFELCCCEGRRSACSQPELSGTVFNMVYFFCDHLLKEHELLVFVAADWFYGQIQQNKQRLVFFSVPGMIFLTFFFPENATKVCV